MPWLSGKEPTLIWCEKGVRTSYTVQNEYIRMKIFYIYSMKHLKTYKLYLENLSQEELDDILDKINAKGYGSLTYSEKNALISHSNGVENDVEQGLPIEINELIALNYNGFVTSMDLQLDSSPVYKSDNQEIHLIESFYEFFCTIVIYGGYKYQTKISEYEVFYTDMTEEILLEIKDVLS